MNTKRKWCEENNPSFQTLPDATDLYTCLPQNRWLCRGKDGRSVNLYCYGKAKNRRNLTVEQYVHSMLFQLELKNIISDICSAVEGRIMKHCHLFDFSNGSLATALELIDFVRLETNASASVAPSQDPVSVKRSCKIV